MTRTLTDEQKYARQMKAIDRKYQRQIAQAQREIARQEHARALGNAITQMTMRYASSHHAVMAAFMSPKGTYCGKPEQHWKRIADRQFAALHRLTYALRNLAEKGI